MAKTFATEMAVGVTSKTIEAHVCSGVSEKYPLERYFRDACMLTLTDGSAEIQKLVVGREILGVSAFLSDSHKKWLGSKSAGNWLNR